MSKEMEAEQMKFLSTLSARKSNKMVINLNDSEEFNKKMQ